MTSSTRSCQANAATARALSLVLRSDLDPPRASRLLAATTDRRALEEAVGHLDLTLFDDEDAGGDVDHVVADATELLVLARQLQRPSVQATRS